MSMFILPVVVALLGAPQEAPADPPPLVTNPAEEAPARAFMEQVWRRYRRISSAGVTMTGTRTWADGLVEPIRTRVMIAPTGEVKALCSTHNLTFKRGKAHADSIFYPGMQVQVPAQPRPDAAVNAMDDAWPRQPVPLPIRLRLGGSPDSAFDTLLGYAGDVPLLTVEAGAWTDGLACEILRLRSADQATDLAVWVDQLTGFIRGIRGSIRPMGDRPASKLELLFETVETERAPMIAVANRGVQVFDSFESMVTAWQEIYAVPAAPVK